jgi:hypothetical protein
MIASMTPDELFPGPPEWLPWLVAALCLAAAVVAVLLVRDVAAERGRRRALRTQGRLDQRLGASWQARREADEGR